MSDQADTLRKMMRARADTGESDAETEVESDQAHSLRQLMRDRSEESAELARSLISRATILTISSGKGGTGKSTLAANLGIALSRQGRRVLLVDADFGLANLDILLGVQPPAVTIEQVLDGTASPRDALVGLGPNLWLLPAASGLRASKKWVGSFRDKLFRLLSTCPWEMDVILIDVGAGIQENVISLHSPLHQSLIVTTPEPTAITDAYGLMKMIRRDAGVIDVGLIVNRVTDAREALRVHQRIREVASRFTDIRIRYLGHVPYDEKFVRSTIARKTLLDWENEGTTVAALGLLAKRIGDDLLGGMIAPSSVRGFGLIDGFTDEQTVEPRISG